MARIDLLTAQMRQRAVKRVFIQTDEKMKLFDANDQQIGAGAALPIQTIRELLGEIAPSALDGAPLTFPYDGPDGNFEIAVAPGAECFEMRALSFAPAQTEPLQTHNSSSTTTISTASATSTAAPSPLAPEAAGWFYIAGDQQLGPHTDAQIKAFIKSGQLQSDTYLWREGLSDWQTVSQSQFKTLLPAKPVGASTPGGMSVGGASISGAAVDGANTWYYRSATGQAVPSARPTIIGMIRNGPLKPDTLVWHESMTEWQSAQQSPLAGDISLAPIAAPNAGYTGPRTLAGTGPYSVYGGDDPNNNSGGGSDIEVPPKARGIFNVGAFLLPVFWCYAMGMPSVGTGLLVYNFVTRRVDIPYLWVPELLFHIGMGIMGNRLAWKFRRFDSIEDFRKCQLIWAAASVAFWVTILTILFFLFRSIIRMVFGI